MRLAVSLGEPAGIGPDIALQLIANDAAPVGVECVLIADRKLLLSRSGLLGLTPELAEFDPDHFQAGFSLLHVPGGNADAGITNPSHAQYVLECLEKGAHGCLGGQFDALVTGPIHKENINAGGVAFTGHTEFLAELCTVPTVVMLLVTPNLRVALQTTHLPLRKVADAITSESLHTKLNILHQGLKQMFGLVEPRIAVTGLNPHAGEGGYLGDEEIKTIAPVINNLAQAGRKISGPWPADTLFTPKHLARFDAVMAMYHDQGLPVLKHLGFGQAVNVTLGLPLIRTSVDHGTALDLAGTGKAETGSFREALNLAANMVNNQSA